MLRRSGNIYSAPPDPDTSDNSDSDIDEDNDDQGSDNARERKNDPSDDKLFLSLGLQYDLNKYSKDDYFFLKKRLGDFFKDFYWEARKYGRRDNGTDLVLYNDVKHVLYTMLANLSMKPYRCPLVPENRWSIVKCKIPTDERIQEIEDNWLRSNLPGTSESLAYVGTPLLAASLIYPDSDTSDDEVGDDDGERENTLLEQRALEDNETDLSRFGENTAIVKFLSEPLHRSGGSNQTQWCYSYPAILLFRDFIIIDFKLNCKDLDWDRRKSFVTVISPFLKNTPFTSLVTKVFSNLKLDKIIIEFV